MSNRDEGMEIRLRLPLGELAIPFSNAEELERALTGLELDRIVRLVNQKFGGILDTTQIKVKQGLEGVYEIGSDGLPNLLQPAKSKIESIGLALYIAAPRGLTGPELEKVSRVKNPSQGFVNQDRYKKYFDRDHDGKIVLSHDGTRWVSEKVLSAMKKEK